MLTVLGVEAGKLNRSLAALLAVAGPVLIGILGFFMATRGDDPQTWDLWMRNGIALWAFFMMPMCVTALTALVAQMEHAPKSWDHLRALPLPRWKLYAAKAVCAFAVVAAMSAGVIVATWLAGSVAQLVMPAMAPQGALDLAAQAKLVGMVLLAGLLMFAVQLWAALRFASFVPALAMGIGGTFFSVAATSAEAGVFFPWQMPVNMLAKESWRVETALTLGLVGGIVALAAMMLHLSRREMV